MAAPKGKEHRPRYQRVSDFFHEEKNYPGESAVIRVRADTLDSFTRERRFGNVLDVACGDGMVAFRILDRCEQLTLLDISRNMIDRARKNIPVGMEDKVKFIKDDILTQDLPGESYDLIICTGLMAHVDDPPLLISKLSNLLNDRGLLFLQNTDSRHCYSKLVRVYRRLLARLREEAYSLHCIPNRRLRRWYHGHGLTAIARYRAMVSFLFLGPVLKEKFKFEIIRFIFGKPERKRMQSLGHDHLILLRKIHAEQRNP